MNTIKPVNVTKTDAATVLTDELNTDATVDTSSTVDVEKLKGDIKTALTDIEGVLGQADGYVAQGVMQESDVAQAQKLKAYLESELALLESDGSTAVNNPDAVDSEINPADQLAIGWNGPMQVRQMSTDGDVLGDNYRGTVYIENSGVYSATDATASSKVALVLDPDVVDVKARTVGNDAVLEVTHSDGTKDLWKLEGATPRTAEMIAIDASRCDNAVNMDLSGAIRVSNGKLGPAFGAVAGFIIRGSKNPDTIKGSEGDDYIFGGGGGDIIYGLGGNDSIFGEAGDDKIIGGVGADDISGGDGYDTVTSSADSLDSITQVENYAEEKLDNLQAGSWLSSFGFDVESKNGELVLTSKGSEINDKSIDMTLPADYTMMNAESSEDGLSTIFTFFNPETGKTAKVRVFGIDEKTDLKIHGNGADNIIDLHGAYINANISLYGGAGNDVLVAPDTDILNIDNRKPIDSNTTRSEMETIADDFTMSSDALDKLETELKGDDTEAEVETFTSEVKNGQIVLTPKVTFASGKTENVTINGPDGLGYSYYSTWKSGNDQMVAFFRQNSDGSVDRTVVKLADCADKINLTVSCGATRIPTNVVNIIDGQSGTDLMYGLAGTTTTDTDTIYKGKYEASSAAKAAADTSAETDATAASTDPTTDTTK